MSGAARDVQSGYSHISRALTSYVDVLAQYPKDSGKNASYQKQLSKCFGQLSQKMQALQNSLDQFVMKNNAQYLPKQIASQQLGAQNDKLEDQMRCAAEHMQGVQQRLNDISQKCISMNEQYNNANSIDFGQLRSALEKVEERYNQQKYISIDLKQKLLQVQNEVSNLNSLIRQYNIREKQAQEEIEKCTKVIEVINSKTRQIVSNCEYTYDKNEREFEKEAQQYAIENEHAIEQIQKQINDTSALTRTYQLQLDGLTDENNKLCNRYDGLKRAFEEKSISRYNIIHHLNQLIQLKQKKDEPSRKNLQRASQPADEFQKLKSVDFEASMCNKFSITNRSQLTAQIETKQDQLGRAEQEYSRVKEECDAQRRKIQSLLVQQRVMKRHIKRFNEFLGGEQRHTEDQNTALGKYMTQQNIIHRIEKDIQYQEGVLQRLHLELGDRQVEGPPTTTLIQNPGPPARHRSRSPLDDTLYTKELKSMNKILQVVGQSHQVEASQRLLQILDRNSRSAKPPCTKKACVEDVLTQCQIQKQRYKESATKPSPRMLQPSISK